MFLCRKDVETVRISQKLLRKSLLQDQRLQQALTQCQRHQCKRGPWETLLRRVQLPHLFPARLHPFDRLLEDGSWDVGVWIKFQVGCEEQVWVFGYLQLCGGGGEWFVSFVVGWSYYIRDEWYFDGEDWMEGTRICVFNLHRQGPTSRRNWRSGINIYCYWCHCCCFKH